jgi:hypothetical protein
MKIIFNHPSAYREINDAPVIPHIGERVFLGFTPAAIVDEVAYDYDKNLVVISFR